MHSGGQGTARSSLGTVLIIDDEPEIGYLIEDLLTEEGYTTFTANSGAEGLRLFAEHTPDLVLLDMFMPQMNGQTVLKQLCAEQPDPTPVVMMSASSLDLELLQQHGVTATIEKPFDLDDLVACVTECIRRS